MNMLFLLLIIIPIALGIWAQMHVRAAYEEYSKIQTKQRIRGCDAAFAVMRSAGIDNVKVVEVGGTLTDHYDPTKKVLALSRDVFQGTSLAAVGIAAHEAGHAIQDKVGYSMLNLRMSLIPVTQLACAILPFVIVGGFVFQLFNLIRIGVVVYLILTVFQLITLPVEFNASSRAKKLLSSLGMVDQKEFRGVSRVLNAAAWTYVAAFVASLATLLRLFLIARSGDND